MSTFRIQFISLLNHVAKKCHKMSGLGMKKNPATVAVVAVPATRRVRPLGVGDGYKSAGPELIAVQALRFSIKRFRRAAAPSTLVSGSITRAAYASATGGCVGREHTRRMRTVGTKRAAT
jgi:hypothetical protein